MSDSKTVETWKMIPSAPTHEASDAGRVRRIGSERTLTPSPASKGRYLVVHIGDRTLYAHRLVVEAHLDLPAGLVVHHKNGCRQDNRLVNLEVTTPAENQRRSHVDRTAHILAGERNPEQWGRRSSLTPVQVQTLRRAHALRKRGAVAKLAREYGISTKVASNAARGESHTWVGPTALETEIARQEALALRAERKVRAQLQRAQAARDANPAPHTPPAAAPRSKFKKEESK